MPSPTIADKINSRLRDGGIVQVTNYARSTVYRQRNAGQFSMDKRKCLIVKRGKQSVCIEGNAIRFGWEVTR